MQKIASSFFYSFLLTKIWKFNIIKLVEFRLKHSEKIQIQKTGLLHIHLKTGDEKFGNF